jgi:Uri superfamily endonuclease
LLAGDNRIIVAAMRSYQLYILLEREIRLAVGRLGSFDFPAGSYVYTGSAKKNLEARVRRHCSRDKKLRWHIDYLLASRHARILRVELSAEEECSLNQAVAGTVLVPGFGASDCVRGCGSHLKWLGCAP